MGSGILIWNSYRKRFNNAGLNENKRSDHKWVYFKNQEMHIYDKVILESCDDPYKLCELEKYYIQLYNTIRPNGYNIADGGDGGCLVRGYNEEEMQEWRSKISKATKEAMQREDVKERLLQSVRNKSDDWKKHISESLTGRKGHSPSEETIEKTRQRMIGNKYGIGNKSRTGMHNSDEMNKRISDGAKNVIHTPEWNKKVGDALRGKKKSEAHKQALRKPKPKYEWLLPDGSIRIMDSGNGCKHKDWIKLNKVS